MEKSKDDLEIEKDKEIRNLIEKYEAEIKKKDNTISEHLQKE